VKKNKSITVYSGQELKLWQKRSAGVRCVFINFQSDTLQVRMQEKIVSIAQKDIHKVKVIHPRPLRRIFGGVLAGLGITSFAYSGLSIIIWLSGAASGTLATTFLLLSPVFLITGGLLLWLSISLNGRKFRLGRRWQIRE
jgi:hypothetical protein